MAPSIAESAYVWLWLTLSNPVNLEKYWRAHSTERNALILTLLQQRTALGEMEEVMHFYRSRSSFSEVLDIDCERTAVSSLWRAEVKEQRVLSVTLKEEYTHD